MALSHAAAALGGRGPVKPHAALPRMLFKLNRCMQCYCQRIRFCLQCNSFLCVRAGQQMIETFDTNKDGEIDYPEFLAMMRANNKDLQARTCLNAFFM